jgi:hypothetical protein
MLLALSQIVSANVFKAHYGIRLKHFVHVRSACFIPAPYQTTTILSTRYICTQHSFKEKYDFLVQAVCGISTCILFVKTVLSLSILHSKAN